MLRILIISTALGKKVYQIDYGTPICIMEQQNSLLYNSCILSFLENVFTSTCTIQWHIRT